MDNDRFFGGPAASAPWPPPRPPPASIPEAVFYGEARPPSEPGFVVRWAETPLRFGVLLFVLGWLGILLQRSFLRQVVVGAPVFEELAKLGLALVVLAPLGSRSVWARLPYGWASGFGFGVFEHFSTYPDEAWTTFAIRVAFHTATAGLSLAAFTLVEPIRDVRTRWLSTVPSTLVHWANNLGAVLLALVSLVTTHAETVGFAWSLLLTGTAFGLTITAVSTRGPLRARASALAERAFVPLGITEAGPDAGPGPPSSGAAPPSTEPRPPHEPPPPPPEER